MRSRVCFLQGVVLAGLVAVMPGAPAADPVAGEGTATTQRSDEETGAAPSDGAPSGRPQSKSKAQPKSQPKGQRPGRATPGGKGSMPRDSSAAQQPPAVDDAHAVAQALGLLHVMGGVEHREPPCSHGLDLVDEQFLITRMKGTERAFTGKYWKTKTAGTYKCVCCGEPLFTSGDKFISECGWPAFSAPIDKARDQKVAEHADFSFLPTVLASGDLPRYEMSDFLARGSTASLIWRAVWTSIRSTPAGAASAVDPVTKVTVAPASIAA